MPEGGTYEQQEVMSARKGGRQRSRLRGSLNGAVQRAFCRGVHPTCLSSPYIIGGPTAGVRSDGCESIKKGQITCTVFLFLHVFI